MADKKYDDRKQIKWKCFEAMKKPFMGLVFIVILLAFLGVVQAQEKYPTRAIELVVCSSPGGGASISVHAYSEDLAKFLKVPVNVVHRAGGAGVTGTAYVFRSKKDGYTLLGAPCTSLVTVPVISKKDTVPYDPLEDFIPLGYLGLNPSVFAVNNNSPFKTLADFIDYARKNPGKLKNATAGVGTESSLNMLHLCNIAKIKIGEIPFTGGDAATMLLGGHMDVASTSLASLRPHIKAGTVRALAVTSKNRNRDLPNVPTTAELGYPDVKLVIWHALYAPAGVPQQVVDVLVPAMEKVLKSPEVIQRGIQAGLEVEYKNPAQIRELLEADIQNAKGAARGAGLIK